MNKRTKSHLKKRFYSYFREQHIDVPISILQRIVDDIEMYSQERSEEIAKMQETINSLNRIKAYSKPYNYNGKELKEIKIAINRLRRLHGI